jgi:hypothetical protein
MFGYAPTVNDNSGEIRAAGTIKGAEGLAGGITSAAGSISGAINQINQLKLQAGQADATVDLAHKMGIIDSGAVDMIHALPWQQKVTIAPNMIQMIGQKTTADHYAMMMGLGQQKLNNASTIKNTGIMPWSSTPAPGGLGGSAAAGDSADSY